MGYLKRKHDETTRKRKIIHSSIVGFTVFVITLAVTPAIALAPDLPPPVHDEPTPTTTTTILP